MEKERRGRRRGGGKKMREGKRKVCLLLDGGLFTPLSIRNEFSFDCVICLHPVIASLQHEQIVRYIAGIVGYR